MRKNTFTALLIIALTAIVSSSCIRDKFQYYGYEDQLEGYFPVDSIEKGHTWTMFDKGVIGVGNIPSGTYKVQLLSGNPFTETDVEVMAEVYKSTLIGQFANIDYVAPNIQTTIYAAALDADGNYLRIGSGGMNSQISFGNTAPTGTPNATKPQRFFYCFEADYPNPGDWDYNDIVMSATKTINEEEHDVVELRVTLHAVGYLSQIAAAIRLVGYQNERVAITRDLSTTFVRYPDRERTFIKNTFDKFAALNGNAIINLFDDAHLAMFHLAEDGSVYRRYFNTVENPSSSNGGAVQPAITVTYYIDFNDEYQARQFTLAELDPFIVVRYGTAGDNFWEVHTYPYKLTEMIYEYYNGAASSYNNGFSWALTIPYASFLYPYEETPIGERKNTIVSGAYQKSGHAFGEWILDHAKAQDWYKYPADGAVYDTPF